MGAVGRIGWIMAKYCSSKKCIRCHLRPAYIQRRCLKCSMVEELDGVTKRIDNVDPRKCLDCRHSMTVHKDGRCVVCSRLGLKTPCGKMKE
jgi:NAD-dependent SIR2 family protein deacetylase